MAGYEGVHFTGLMRAEHRENIDEVSVKFDRPGEMRQLCLSVFGAGTRLWQGGRRGLEACQSSVDDSAEETPRLLGPEAVGRYNDVMLRRRFGRTEIAMPVFSCGGMRYQFKWQDRPLGDIPAANQANLAATIHRALELGINHIETARGYGSSERQLGQVLPQFERSELVVQTKVSPKANPAEFERDFHDSLARLGLDYVDLLGLHGINDERTCDWAIRPGGCFEVANRLRERGKVRFIGFSTHGPLDVIERAINFGEAETGKGFDYVNLHWYFIFQRNWPAIEAAIRRDMGVFIISPSDKGGRLYEPPDKLRTLCEPLSPMVFNDLFCLSHPQVHTLSLGAARASDFDEHMGVLPLLEDAEAVLEPIVERLSRAMEQATGHRHPEAFLPGLPAWQQLPNNYNLQMILWLLNLAKGWDLVEYGKWRFGLLNNAGHWFAGNHPRSLDEISDGPLLEALEGYPNKQHVPGLLREATALLGGQENKRLSES